MKTKVTFVGYMNMSPFVCLHTMHLLWWFSIYRVFVGPLPRVRPRNGILALLVVVLLLLPLRSEFIGEL